MDDDETSQRSRKAEWAVVLIALPLLYVLSIGPASYFHEKVHLSHPRAAHWLQTAYYPLRGLLVYDMLRSPLLRYTAWWQNLDKPPPTPAAPAVHSAP